MAGESSDNVLALVVSNFDQGGVARVTFHQRDDLAALRVAQQIPLPVTGNGSVLGLGRTLSDRERVGDLSRSSRSQSTSSITNATNVCRLSKRPGYRCSEITSQQTR